MSKITVFQESFLVSGIMCFDACGKTIQGFLQSCIKDCIENNIIPPDARLIVDAEPNGLGIHKLIISIESEQDDFLKVENFHAIIAAKIREDIGFDVIDDSEETSHKKSNWTHWINILINIISMGVVIACTLVFPPSILLTAGLATLSFLTTTFTAREYLLAFFRNFQTKSFFNMATTISLGWFLSLGHALFHSITMPLAASFSMVFMSFLMPIMLITCINGMDEIKRLVMEKSKQIQLTGLKTLFPKMSETYRYYQLSQQDFSTLSDTMSRVAQYKNKDSPLKPSEEDMLKVEHESLSYIQTVLDTRELKEENKNLLREGMLIEVQTNECFPVDCILVQGNTIIDASLLTGEPQQGKQPWQNIPAGAINLGQPVTVYAVKNPYNSTVNSLLFRSNRARDNVASPKGTPKFVYLYTVLIFIGIAGAVLAPLAFGVITLSLVVQNIIGILFSTCPCTIAIAHELPKLISIHHRNKKGIHLRDDSLIDAGSDEIHTVVFDKTGTLTTGNSVVESSDFALNSPLLQRVYILEKTYGRGHPLAKAITKYYEDSNEQPMFGDITECKLDDQNRGLTGRVQGNMIQIGSYDYLKNNGVTLPELHTLKMGQGFSSVFVAEEGRYKGVIYIKHEVRKGVIEALTRLKKDGKKIIMLTGDNQLSAEGFNQKINHLFDDKDIHWGKTPQDKESFLKNYMSTSEIKPKGVWFVGDGLNDAPCCRIVSEKGGISCAISSSDKSAFFTDISLNGSLDYIFKHHKLNLSLQKNITQNKGILIYSTVAFLAFIISFSIAGIAVSPLIPMAIMLSTTLFVLFNSYRTQLIIDIALDKEYAWYKKLLSSDFSIGLLLTASTLLIGATLVTTIATGGLTLPMIAFTAGVLMACSSACTLSAITLLAIFSGIFAATLLTGQSENNSSEIQLTKSSHTDTFYQPKSGSITREKAHGSLLTSPFAATRQTGMRVSSIMLFGNGPIQCPVDNNPRIEGGVPHCL